MKATAIPRITRRTPIDDMPELLTATEAAAWLGVSPWGVYDMARRGVLPVIRFGRHVRIPRAALAKLAGHQVAQA
jgi:excisionase family DNA binding protein